MSFLRLKIPVKAYDAYLYGGYMFLFMRDGTIRYAKFDDLIWAASDESVNQKKRLQLTFLPHQYLKGNSYKFLRCFKSVIERIEYEQNACINDSEINIDESNIEQLLTPFADLDELPFDTCIYGGELFIASDAGVQKSSLHADRDYSIHPSRPNKIMDCPAISLTAKAGMLAVSADKEGLFSHEIFSERNPYINDRPAYEEMSIKAEWSTSFTLINYSDLCRFSLLENDVEEKKSEQLHHLPSNYRKDVRGRKIITSIGKKDVNMALLMEKTEIEPENLTFAFNTQSSGFFFFKNGELQVKSMLKKENSYQYSSKSVHESDLSNALGGRRPMSAIAIPNGCMVETYDKVFLVKGNAISIIADEPIYGIRSYLSSNNYRNLATVVYNDHVEIIAFQQLPSPSASNDRPFRPGYLKERSAAVSNIEDDTLPF